MKHTLSTIHRNVRHAAFTVTELLAVIAIIVVLIVIAVPSFQAMLKSSEETMAESLLTTAIKAGRDAAFRAGTGNDAALVFFFEPGGRCSVIPCVRAGSVRDLLDGGPEPIEREVFVPAPDFAPISMPKYWSVRGWIGPNTITGTGDYYPGAGRYQTGNFGNWVFPETGFFNHENPNDGRQRSTFMIRFAGGTGALVATPPTAVLVVAPRGTRVTSVGSMTAAQTALDPNEPRWSGDLVRFVRAVQAGQNPVTNAQLSMTDKRDILGRENSNIVMARPVSVIALYNEQQLAGALGTRLDRDTDSIYKPWATGQSEPELIAASIQAQAINRWMEGDTDFSGSTDGGNAADVPLAKLFSIDRYTGTLRRLEVQP